MTTNLFELRKQHRETLDSAERITSAAAGRDLTASESQLFEQHMRQANSLGQKIQERESQSTIRGLDPVAYWTGTPSGGVSRTSRTQQKPAHW